MAGPAAPARAVRPDRLSAVLFRSRADCKPAPPNTILAARANIGLVDFNYQLSLLEQLGVARRVEKPFISVKDGSTGTFENGTQIPVVLQALNNLGGSGGGGSIEFINAGTTLSVHSAGD